MNVRAVIERSNYTDNCKWTDFAVLTAIRTSPSGGPWCFVIAVPLIGIGNAMVGEHKVNQ